MQEILQQLGTLFLGSIPTLILFIVLVLAYQLLVQGPLSKTLAERRARTSGAIEEANKAIAAAEAKAEEYAEKLRHARAQVFRVREQRLQEWATQREVQMDAARKRAQQRVLEVKLSLDAEADAARTALISSADQLAEQVVRAVLPAAAGGTR